MARILVVSGSYIVDHPKKDLGIVRELQRRGHRVRHVVIGRDVPPPYPRSAVEHDDDFRAVGSVWVNRRAGVLPFMVGSEVLLIPIHKGIGDLCRWAQRLGKVVVQHDNHGGLDSYYYGADLAAVKGPYFAEFVRRRWGLAEDVVVSTGCVQFDAAVGLEVERKSRDEFCRIYGLDPAKRIAVWLPTQDHRQRQYYEWSANKYREICEIVSQTTNHNLIIKPHPADYLEDYKGGLTPDGQHGWLALFPQGAVCRPEHKYACFRHCDVGLANWSSIGLEFPIFRKPFLYVDVAENPRLEYLRQHPFTDHPVEHDRGAPVPGFVGQVCASAELPRILETCSYEVKDEQLYDRHIARFLHRADGRAFERVADLVERGCEMARTRRRRGRVRIAGAGPGAVENTTNRGA